METVIENGMAGLTVIGHFLVPTLHFKQAWMQLRYQKSYHKYSYLKLNFNYISIQLQRQGLKSLSSEDEGFNQLGDYKLHWMLDVQMGEDQDSKAERRSAKAFAVIRRIALNIIRTKNTHKKRSLRRVMKCAGWDQDYLLKLLL